MSPDVEHILDQARVELPASSDAAIQHKLFDVLQEFFNDSSWWMEDIAVNVIPDTVAYDLVPSDGQIIRLAGVVDQNMILQPAIMPTIGTILFRSPYANPATFTATVVKNVVLPTGKEFVPVLPDGFLAVWGFGILGGLVGHMMEQMGKPYANVGIANYHLSRFRNAIAAARVAALRRNAFGVQAWAFPQDIKMRSQRGGISVGNQERFT
jgi:hypothetical protein